VELLTGIRRSLRWWEDLVEVVDPAVTLADQVVVVLVAASSISMHAATL
jgi:hypothetical protein